MATKREYTYQIRGNKLSLLEKDFTTSDGLNYTYVDGAGLDAPSGSTTLKSPVATVTNGLEIEYAYNPITITDESDIIDLPSYLTKALVYYVKAKIQEDIGQMELREYFMAEFRKQLERHESSKVAGPRRIMPGVGSIR